MLIGTPHPTARNILFKHLEESNKVENISFVFFYTTIVCSTLSTAFSTRNRICNYIYIILINNFSSVSAVNANTHTDGSRFFFAFYCSCVCNFLPLDMVALASILCFISWCIFDYSSVLWFSVCLLLQYEFAINCFSSS